MGRFAYFLVMIILFLSGVVGVLLNLDNLFEDLGRFAQPQLSCAATSLSLSELQAQANAITVKVFAEDISGSGILLQKKENSYLVITNDHVIAYSSSDELNIKTVDGVLHRVKLSAITRLENKDLAWFTFDSELDYQVSDFWKQTPVQENQTVFVAGFPIEANRQKSRGFLLTQGKIVMIIPKQLTGGYQLGYSNDVQKGMSGGPVLNCQGQLVGVNGLHKHPIWDYRYIFEDGTIASNNEQTKMRSLSWGISGQLLKQLIPHLI
ncbi:serine protease [Gloeocapsa sp. PCC 73106]|uniref:S1 family peptidase n=1 Tax=Gloeocapsa sp. PCC 73106 TaxID=102232 RepID=UPI0002ABC700|nr:serine protease [Gloeocapsa sp. PCC 73106]ELR97694.1 trypsin-like serine protease with C-terminal PDZ domain [Gloeocapsa sp. PCC 73106]